MKKKIELKGAKLRLDKSKILVLTLEERNQINGGGIVNKKKSLNRDCETEQPTKFY